MKTNKYLYGENIEVPELDAYVIARRIELLEDNLAEILMDDYMTRDLARIRAIEKAKSFWINIVSLLRTSKGIFFRILIFLMNHFLLLRL